MTEQAGEIPFKDEAGNVIGRVVSWSFDPETQLISFTAELEDGTEIQGTTSPA